MKSHVVPGRLLRPLPVEMTGNSLSFSTPSPIDRPRPLPVRALLLDLLIATGSMAHAAVLVPTGALWRWRTGASEASTPVTAWRLNGFDDSQFTTAPAPFWYDTTGDSSTLVGGTQ